MFNSCSIHQPNAGPCFCSTESSVSFVFDSLSKFLILLPHEQFFVCRTILQLIRLRSVCTIMLSTIWCALACFLSQISIFVQRGGSIQVLMLLDVRTH